jgi:hypothetical protein
MDSSVRDMPDFELALLRRGLDELAAGSERCHRCNRTPLVGEHVHVYQNRVLCDLCRELELDPPESSRAVHGPAFGNSIRIIDQRAA